MLGNIFAGLGGLLGGIIGGHESTKGKTKSKSYQKSLSVTTPTVHLGKLVAQAERFGFNPMTILSAGGLGAYTTTTSFGRTQGASKSKTKGQSYSTTPLGAGITAAAGSFGNALNIANQPQAPAADPWYGLRDPSFAGGDDLVGAQLSSTAVPTLAAPPVTAHVPTLAGRAAFPAPEIEAASVTNPFPQDWWLRPDPTVPDGGTRYQSEIAETVGDAVRLHRDIKASSPVYSGVTNMMTDYEGLSKVWEGIALKPWSSFYPAPVVETQTQAPLRVYSGGGW